MKQYSLVIGRFQTIPPHAGHLALINHILKEGGNVMIALRKEDGTANNPYTIEERHFAFYKIYEKEIEDGRVIILDLPADIKDVCYGRKVGWGIREIRFDEQTESISATEIRKKKSEDNNASA
jgi:nicotinamide mononucleotide adenylyltransferase